MIIRGSDCGVTEGIVMGEGPKGARLAMIGEAPARNEVEEGRPWSGRMGRYLHGLTRMIGLPPREMTYMSNLLKVPSIDNEKDYLMEQQIKEWEGVLHEELDSIRPSVVASLGAWSTRWFLRTYSPGYPDTNDLDWLHGIPRIGTAPWGRFILVPCFNPAAGIHDSEALPKIFADLTSLREVLAGRLVPYTTAPPQCHYLREHDDRRILDAAFRSSHL